jgi:hypothetical protein
MQTKDIPELPILEFLKDHGGIGCHHWEPQPTDTRGTVRQAMPVGLPGKLILAKMRMLIRRGLVGGCGCGCRGDFELTAKGREYLATMYHTVHNPGQI